MFKNTKYYQYRKELVIALWYSFQVSKTLDHRRSLSVNCSLWQNKGKTWHSWTTIVHTIHSKWFRDISWWFLFKSYILIQLAEIMLGIMNSVWHFFENLVHWGLALLLVSLRRDTHNFKKGMDEDGRQGDNDVVTDSVCIIAREKFKVNLVHIMALDRKAGRHCHISRQARWSTGKGDVVAPFKTWDAQRKQGCTTGHWMDYKWG